MDPNDFLDALERLRSSLARQTTRIVHAVKERNQMRSVVGAWFEVYRPNFLGLIAEEDRLLPIDELMQKLLKLASEDSSRVGCKRVCRSIQRYFCDNLLLQLSRAYWSRAPIRAPAGRDLEVARRLQTLDGDLSESYEQVVEDLMEATRRTYRGTAAELREVVRGVLDRQAPDEEVKNTDWYKEARRSGRIREDKPTQVEKTKYILWKRGLVSAATDAAESYMSSIEDRLGQVVRAIYRRASNSTHSGAERDEVLQQLRYVNALLAELLPRES